MKGRLKMKEDKRIIELSESEIKIIIYCLNEERNKLSLENDSREDIRKLLLKIMNSPEKKKHNKLFGAR